MINLHISTSGVMNAVKLVILHASAACGMAVVAVAVAVTGVEVVVAAEAMVVVVVVAAEGKSDHCMGTLLGGMYL